VTSPDDERDRVRDLDDTSAVPDVDLPTDPGPSAGPPGGVGDVPTHPTASEPMPGTSEENPRVEGEHMPEHDPET
jgi:hypothetical protein